MTRSRQIPGIAHQRPGFAPGALPPVQSPLSMPSQSQQQSPEASVTQQLQELALEIYARLAVLHLNADHYTEPLSHEHLKALANHSQIAAKAYFESLGVRFDGQ